MFDIKETYVSMRQLYPQLAVWRHLEKCAIKLPDDEAQALIRGFSFYYQSNEVTDEWVSRSAAIISLIFIYHSKPKESLQRYLCEVQLARAVAKFFRTKSQLDIHQVATHLFIDFLNQAGRIWGQQEETAMRSYLSAMIDEPGDKSILYRAIIAQEMTDIFINSGELPAIPQLAEVLWITTLKFPWWNGLARLSQTNATHFRVDPPELMEAVVSDMTMMRVAAGQAIYDNYRTAKADFARVGAAHTLLVFLAYMEAWIANSQIGIQST